MSIISITSTQTGLVGVLPSIAYINTTDTVAEVTTAGYLNKAVAEGTQFSLPCIAAVSTKETPTAQAQVDWYRVQHTSGNWSLIYGQDEDKVTPEEVQRQAFNFSEATGINDAFVVTLDPAPSAYTDGMLVTFNSGSLTNLTTTPTLKVNALPAVNITAFAGSLIGGDISENTSYIFVYNESDNTFQIINPSVSIANTTLVQNQAYSYALDAGVANAYIANILPFNDNIVAGMKVVMTVSNSNTGASTLTVNGDTQDILLSNGGALSGGELIQNQTAELVNSPASGGWLLINPANSSTPSPTTSQVNLTYTGNVTELPALEIGYESLYFHGEYYQNLISCVFNNTSFTAIGPTTVDFGAIQMAKLTFNTASLFLTWTSTTSLSFPALIYIHLTTGFTMQSLTTLSMPLLKYSVGAFTFTGNALTTFSLPSLVYAGGFALSGTSIATINMPSLINNTAAFSPTLAALTTLNMSNLVNNIGAFAPTVAALTTLSLPSLTTLGAGFAPVAALATTVTLTSLATVTGAFNPSFSSLTTLSLPALVSVSTTFTITAANLVTFSIGSTLLSIGGNFTMTGMKLDEASVDGILVSLAALDGTGGTTAYSSKTINVSGGTSSAPSATGLAAKAVLQARSCTVTTN